MKKKIAILGSGQSIHVLRWVNALAAVENEIEMHLITFNPLLFDLDSRVQVHQLPVKSKLGYFLNVFALKKVLKRLKPDLLNVHYVGGYGLLGTLSGYKPRLLSIWGSDVYVVPYRSAIEHKLICWFLNSATALASTSHCMKEQTETLVSHPHLFVTPFGIDEAVFLPAPVKPVHEEIRFGIVKSMNPMYRIHVAIEAFAKALKKTDKQMLLQIAGAGPEKEKYMQMVRDLNIADHVQFVGVIPNAQIPEFLNNLDVFINIGKESFGCAILEASACGLPLLASNVDGPGEITIPDVTGIVVPLDDVDKAAEAMVKLAEDKDLRVKLGKAGREHVLRKYRFTETVDYMVSVYQRTLDIARDQ